MQALCGLPKLQGVRTNSKKETEWRHEWREQCRRQLNRSTMARIKYGFAWVHKPVLDDGPSRTFDSMAAYRLWCHENLPAYLGYRIVEPRHAAQ